MKIFTVQPILPLNRRDRERGEIVSPWPSSSIPSIEDLFPFVSPQYPEPKFSNKKNFGLCDERKKTVQYKFKKFMKYRATAFPEWDFSKDFHQATPRKWLDGAFELGSRRPPSNIFFCPVCCLKFSYLKTINKSENWNLRKFWKLDF